MLQRKENQQIGIGILLVIGMHIAAAVISVIIAFLLYFLPNQRPTNFYQINPIFGRWLTILLYAFYGIGLAQNLYIVPAVIMLLRRKQWGLMKGVISGAIITALMNLLYFSWLLR